MEFEKYGYELDSCSACGCDDQLAVKTLVWELAAHSQGTRSFKKGGDALGELRVECDSCGACIWTADNFSPTPVDVDGWTHGSPCPKCSETSIGEIHVDWRYRTLPGDLVTDGDRVDTVEYRCRGCESVLASGGHSTQ